MPPAYSRIWPWIFALLVALMVYRRFRRNFGRQPLRTTLMTVRTAILIVLAAVLAPVALRGIAYAAAAAAGAAAGVSLALWGASRTRFVRDGGRLFYIPHTYTGIAVSALVLGRLAYRFVSIYPSGEAAPGAPSAMVQTPLTLGLFFVLIGYYVCYYGRVIWKSKRITAADLEAPPPASESAPDISHLAK
jgi:hypothetical protein